MGSEDPDRIRVLELLGNWKIMLDESREALREEERELVMNLSPAYLKWKEETLNEGIQIGEQQKAEGIALKMLAAGMDLSQIAQLTGLTLDQIRQLQTE
jgi:predicted transposase/invertase (TIGR01784 family)